MSHRWFVVLVLLIPAVALAAWPVSQQLEVWRAPEPERVEPWPGSDRVPVACTEVDLLPGYTVEAADNAHQFTRVSLDTATVTTRRVVAKQRFWPFFRYALYGAGPRLLYLTTPEGDEYLAWARMLVWNGEGEGMVGTGDLLFLDARTGDPLLLVTDIAVSDPALNCPVVLGEFERVVDPLLSLIGLGMYLLLLVLGWALYRLWRIYRGGVRVPNQDASEE